MGAEVAEVADAADAAVEVPATAAVTAEKVAEMTTATGAALATLLSSIAVEHDVKVDKEWGSCQNSAIKYDPRHWYGLLISVIDYDSKPTPKPYPTEPRPNLLQ